MIDKTLQEIILDAPLVIENYVNGEPKCNYEIYLTELINCSKYFMKITNGELFVRQEEQSQGECDAETSNYSIDYKLFVTRSRMQALRETSESISKIGEGVYAFGSGRCSHGKEYTAVRIAAALRKKTLEDYSRILNCSDNFVEKEIASVLTLLTKKKNLFLFYPYTMLFSEPCSFAEGCKNITGAFNEDLHNICLFRQNVAPGFDTYLSVIYEDKLLIFERDFDKWILRDFVELNKSKTYTDLFYTFGNGGFNIRPL